MMDFDKIKNAVNSIEMSKTMKNRIKENCHIIEKEKTVLINFKRWISIACAFGILMSIMIGISFFDKNGNFQVGNFSITAYAMSDDGNQLNTELSSEKATFEISTEDRIGLIGGVGGGFNLIFTDVMLNITGEHIDSITYTISEGKFIEDVTLTASEARDKDWLLSEKIYIILGAFGSDIYEGIKEIGNTYTVAYNEQDQYKYSLAIPHDGNFVVVDDIIINVIVKYTNGKFEQQDIVVTQESNSISLKLK